jgi:hypothetical protein
MRAGIPTEVGEMGASQPGTADRQNEAILFDNVHAGRAPGGAG